MWIKYKEELYNLDKYRKIFVNKNKIQMYYDIVSSEILGFDTENDAKEFLHEISKILT